MNEHAHRTPPAERSVAVDDAAWIVLVYERTVQQTFAPDARGEGLRAAAESPLPVTAYEVRGDQVPPPVPGSKVDPESWGWSRVDAPGAR